MATQIQIRRDDTAGWADADPILAEGELGLDTTLGKFKIGDGTSAWSALSFYAGSGTTETTPLPSFLEYSAGRDHLPALNQNFGWDSNGLWFGDAITEGPWGTPSYPVYTDVEFQEFDKTVVTFDVAIEDFCSDVGVCVYPVGETPNWAWESNGTRIAAQFDCPNPVIHGMSSSNTGDTNEDDIPDVGMYRVVFTYDPNAETDKVVFDTYLIDGNTLTLRSHLTLNEQFELNGGTYKVGFASDNNYNDEGAQNPPHITYISNLTIDVNDGETVYEDSLQNGYSGATVNLVAPLNIKDVNGENLLRIEKSYTGTTRIDALQDDLALRSANDILLYAGDDGPGKVYIGWGNDDTNAFPQNEVATKGYVDDQVGIGSDIKTVNWGYPSDNAIAIMPETDNESIALKSSDAAAIRWHIRNNVAGSVSPTEAVVTPGDGNYQVVFTIPEQESVPPVGEYFYTIYCPENSAYDAALYPWAATTTTLTFYYEGDPGVFNPSGAYINFPSIYSQFEVNEGGAHVKIANWSSLQGSYSHNWNFQTDGSIEFPNLPSNGRTGNGEVLKFGTPTSQSIITGAAPYFQSPDAQRIVIAGQDGIAGDGYDGEGGDVYLWAGQGGGTDGNGGDIKLDGGNGQGTGQGGYVKIRGGFSQAGVGGNIEISAGGSYEGSAGDITIKTNAVATTGAGADINIQTYNTGNIVLRPNIGENQNGGHAYVGPASDPLNQIATKRDIPTGATGSFVSVDNKEITVTNGIITSITAL